jgi:glyoxylase-like metal-dependent hydrolase (beta-lactamase superfamily II)
MTALKVADRWFERKTISDDITHIWEPHVHPLLRCNVWHVRGRDKDMLIDTGMGLSSLKNEIQDLGDKPVTAVATHIHYDHVGCLHEFDDRIMHKVEAPRMESYEEFAPLRTADFPPDVIEGIVAAGYEEPEGDCLITASPNAEFDVDRYAIVSTKPTRTVDEGDVIDIGDRHFEVLHLPGHSPGSMGLWEKASGILFSGDAIYDGPLLDQLPDSDIADYIATMKRLKELPVRVVHGGHEPSFGRARLHELADKYLAARDK